MLTAPWEINADRVLCIPDVHQDTAWAKAVIAHESACDRVVLLGDYFDSFKHPPQVAGARETAEWVQSLIRDPSRRYHLCQGNHDVGYSESWAYNSRYTHKPALINQCSGYTRSKSMEVNKVLSWEDWQSMHLFYLVNGWLVSHAGLHPSFWRPNLDVTDNLTRLDDDAQEATAHYGDHNLLRAGFGRGGMQTYGGITWLDWDTEFEDNEVLPPQLVGHSQAGCVRRIGRSYCIDTNQSSYALVSRDGAVTFKTLRQYGGRWYDVDGKGQQSPTYWREDETMTRDDTAHAAARQTGFLPLIDPRLLS